MQEVADRTVSVRRLGEQGSTTMTLDAAIAEFGLASLPPSH
jgi:hypothetical protein